jgi:hypothetical protein
VELGRAHDAHRDRPRQGGPLVRDLGGVVPAGELVDPDDRHEDQPPHAGPITRLMQVAGRGREELGRGLLVRRRPVAASMIVSTPARASSRPSPVITSTPLEREIGTTSYPRDSRMSTTGRPTRPVAPATAILVLRCISVSLKMDVPH